MDGGAILFCLFYFVYCPASKPLPMSGVKERRRTPMLRVLEGAINWLSRHNLKIADSYISNTTANLCVPYLGTGFCPLISQTEQSIKSIGEKEQG